MRLLPLLALVAAPLASAQTVSLSARVSPGDALGPQVGGSVALAVGPGHVRLGGWAAQHTEQLLVPHVIPCHPSRPCDRFPSSQSTRTGTVTAAYTATIPTASPALAFYIGPSAGVLRTVTRTDLPGSTNASWTGLAGATAGAELRIGRVTGMLGTELGLDLARAGDRRMVGVFGPTVNLGVGWRLR